MYDPDETVKREQEGRRAMYTHPQRRSAKLTQKLRQEAGRWLRELREERGLSQRDLAQKVGAEYYTFISQLEHGRGRIPPDRYLVWARALDVEPREFVQGLMSYYDPVTYDIVFGRESRPERSAASASRPARRPPAVFLSLAGDEPRRRRNAPAAGRQPLARDRFPSPEPARRSSVGWPLRN